MNIAYWWPHYYDEDDNDKDGFLLQKPDTSSLSSSSLQMWKVAPLCNGKLKVIETPLVFVFVYFIVLLKLR